MDDLSGFPDAPSPQQTLTHTLVFRLQVSIWRTLSTTKTTHTISLWRPKSRAYWTKGLYCTWVMGFFQTCFYVQLSVITKRRNFIVCGVFPAREWKWAPNSSSGNMYSNVFVKLKKEKLFLWKLSNINKGRKNRIMNPVFPLSSFINYQHAANIVPLVASPLPTPATGSFQSKSQISFHE